MGLIFNSNTQLVCEIELKKDNEFHCYISFNLRAVYPDIKQYFVRLFQKKIGRISGLFFNLRAEHGNYMRSFIFNQHQRKSG